MRDELLAGLSPLVGVTIRLPVPRGLGWVSGLLQSQVRRELLAAVAEDKHDIEVRGYPRQRPALGRVVPNR